MGLLFTVVEGWTKELGPFVLRVNNQPLDLTGMTVALMIRPQTSNTFSDTSGDVRIDPDQAGTGRGKVYYKPDADDFKASKTPYACHWQVTDSAGDVVFIPLGDPDTIKVARV